MKIFTMEPSRHRCRLAMSCENWFVMKSKTEKTQIDRKDDILRRLRCIEGHVAGIARMVEAERSCPAIVAQLHAVRGALEKVALSLLQMQFYVSLANQVQAQDCEDLNTVMEDVAELMLGLRLR